MLVFLTGIYFCLILLAIFCPKVIEGIYQRLKGNANPLTSPIRFTLIWTIFCIPRAWAMLLNMLMVQDGIKEAVKVQEIGLLEGFREFMGSVGDMFHRPEKV